MRKVAIRGDARQIASTAEDSANSRCWFVLRRFLRDLVGAAGFEPAAPCAQGRCATRLRYAPTCTKFIIRRFPARGLVVPIGHCCYHHSSLTPISMRRPAYVTTQVRLLSRTVATPLLHAT